MLTSKQLSRHNFSLGQHGEKQAWQYLIDQGYEVLAANVRFGNHEADLVAWDKKLNELVFCEVKTRISDQFGTPSQAVNSSKLKSMGLVARKYVQTHHLNLDYRFDIISIISGKIEHYENVSWLFKK